MPTLFGASALVASAGLGWFYENNIAKVSLLNVVTGNKAIDYLIATIPILRGLYIVATISLAVVGLYFLL